MTFAANTAAADHEVSYEDAPIAQVEVDGVELRVDAGRGSAVAISRREVGTWRWADVVEGRWDGTRLKAKSLEHPVVAALERALRDAMKALNDG